MKWAIEMLQLRDLETYNLDGGGLRSRGDLKNAVEELNRRTSDDVFGGLIVKTETKRRTCKAFAVCLRELPGLPLRSIPLEKLAVWLCNVWAEYERTSGLLSSIAERREQIHTPLFRHATVELAVRAGAVAYLCNDADVSDDRPVWSQDAKLTRHLRGLMKFVGPREKCAGDLWQSKSEVGRWLDDLDVPPASAIAKWESLLAIRVNGKDSNSCPLWRLYIGRRIWNSIRNCISGELGNDMLRAYCRIRRRVIAYLRWERRGTQGENRGRAVLLALRGRIGDPLLAAQLVNGETDILWRKHIEAIFQIDGAPTIDIARLCQTWAAVFSIFNDPQCVRKPKNFDDFIRDYYLKAARGGSPSAEYAKLLEEMTQRERKWDLNGAADCAVRLVALAPFAAGSWHALGRIRRLQKNREATEWCFRKALELDPTALDVRTDLAVHLIFIGQIDEARELLEGCTEDRKTRVEWRFAHGMLLLSSQQPQEALREMLKCAEEGFVPGVCYQFAAIAAGILNLPIEKREYQKRAAELGAEGGDNSH
ncbi:MAG: hypothetical protein L0Y58_17230 [Verrucomicrobia subdivision 3 bacterium]|nr:hypothetical protein [Limisphaerales bacterium]